MSTDARLTPHHTPDASFALWLRPHTSDLASFNEVFTSRCYGSLDDLPNVSLVIDCGANVGCASAYFLTRFPDARLIAVEPDPANFAVLRRNLEPYGGRATALRAAIWTHDRGVVMDEARYRDGREWSRQVRDTRPNETATIPSLTLASLIGDSRVGLLKVDIEGAEGPVFAAPGGWLDRVDALAIEVHDDTTYGPCCPVVANAMAGRGLVAATYGDTTIFRWAGEAADRT